MKFLETHFDDYLRSNKLYNLHPSLTRLYDRYPENVMPNTIFYGPPGTGKYTQSLVLIQRYSPSHLKYEKRMLITYENVPLYIKVSDIHFEINMAMLGCNSKVLWNEIYSQIIDVVSTRPSGNGIIMCKNFHSIHSELLDVFYSYFRCTNPKIHISFVIITDNLSFINSSILSACEKIHLKRPTLQQYNRLLSMSVSESQSNNKRIVLTLNNVNKITNIKSIKTTNGDGNGTNEPTYVDEVIGGDESGTIVSIYESYIKRIEKCDAFKLPHTMTCIKIFKFIIHPETIQLLDFRDTLYDILICDLDIHSCIWFILNHIIHYFNEEGITIPTNVMSDILINTHSFLHMFNNNYRPIYHLERFAFMLINNIQSVIAHHKSVEKVYA
jgi:hypothetical protein